MRKGRCWAAPGSKGTSPQDPMRGIWAAGWVSGSTWSWCNAQLEPVCDGVRAATRASESRAPGWGMQVGGQLVASGGPGGPGDSREGVGSPLRPAIGFGISLINPRRPVLRGWGGLRGRRANTGQRPEGGGWGSQLHNPQRAGGSAEKAPLL